MKHNAKKMYFKIFLSFLVLCVTSIQCFKSLMGFSNFKISNAFMFSGIIEEIGSVESFINKKNIKMWDDSIAEGVELEVIGNITLGDAYIGCSVAVNGVCLTVTSINSVKSSFKFNVAPETLRRSNLCKLSNGHKVNLERALLNNGRNSGHTVQGHVDCTAIIAEKWKENESLWLKLEIPKFYKDYLIPKGFIAVDGTSLTICEVQNVLEPYWFTLMLVPHTQNSIILPNKKMGEEVNIEIDLISKINSQTVQNLISDNERLTEELLKLNERILKIEKMLL